MSCILYPPAWTKRVTGVQVPTVTSFDLLLVVAVIWIGAVTMGTPCLSCIITYWVALTTAPTAWLNSVRVALFPLGAAQSQAKRGSLPAFFISTRAFARRKAPFFTIIFGMLGMLEQSQLVPVEQC
jgi:hypothetical protein